MTSCIIPGNVQNVVTEMRYGPGGQLVELIAKNPVTGDQVTRYEYGVTLADSAVASNRLLRAEVYPDAVDSSDRVKYSYNRQGQRIRMTDQNGSVHEYEHDLLGRQTADKVTTLGDGVGGAVRRIGTTYEVRGMAEKVTSYSDAAGATPVNEVQNVYNSFGQLKEQYQEHSGSVNTGTTPKVEYAYADGSANTIRQTSMTYPNGRELQYLYDDTHADKLSRIRTLRWDGTDVCRYAYLGLNTFVTTDYLQPQVKLDYASGSGANPYAGFDRFGRIIDLLWTKYGASSSSSSSSGGGAGNDLVHLKYGYDRASNRTFREDLVAQSYGKDFDELYEYDGLHRLKKFHRGRLTDDNRTVTSPTLQQGWQLDATGNWGNFTQNDQADASQTLDQQRLANRVNEITQIARTVGPDWATPEYDRNGNMTVIPQPKVMTQTFQGTWDAWNRLVKLEDIPAFLQDNCYDGLHRHVQQTSLNETLDCFYSDAWQVLEEYSRGSALLYSSSSSGPTVVSRQFVWGERYVDDLLLRNQTSPSPLDDSPDEQFYPVSDSNWNVTGIVNAVGLIQERFSYDAYGKSTVLTGSFNSCSSSSYAWETRFGSYRQDTTSELIYVRSREMHVLIGGWLSRDPIGFAGDPQNLYRYVRNRPNDRTDPYGEVEFDITPGKVESMDWYESKRGGGGEVGRTVIVKLAAPWKGQAAECGKKGQVKFTVRAELHIRLDSAELKKTRFSKAKAYGHEQVHVENMITIIKREAKVFDGVEAKVFDTPAEAKAAAEEAIAAFDKAVHEAYELDAKHEGKDPMSPPKGGGVQPKGTMPAKPKGTE